MNTADAARAAGVTTRQLLYWQGEGWLTPKDNGRDGQGRRLEWSSKDVDQAKGMANQESHKSASEAMVDSLGGQAFVISLGRARALQCNLRPSEVVISGPRGTHIVQRNSLIEVSLSMVGAPMIMLGYDLVQ